MRSSQSKIPPQNQAQPPKGKVVQSLKAPIQQVQEIKPFNVNDYAKDGISKDEVMEFKTAFDIFDPNGTGRVEMSEIKEAFINLGFHHQSKFAETILHNLQKRNGGVIEFGEFIHIATARLNENFTEPQTTLVFSAFDPKGNGRFNVYDLKDTVRDLGEDMNEDEIERIFRQADTDEDGYITTEDFYNIVTGKNYS